MLTITASQIETEKFASDLAADIDAKTILCLHGNLGAGKSVFARALIRALANDPALEVPSPTFTLVQNYDTPRGPLYHFDLYRLKDPDEIFELGWEEVIASGITIIEWPERLGPYKPPATLDIHIRAIENKLDSREILVNRT